MVSLTDLRARDVTPTWQEAVAVVQELLHTVVATQGSADRLPDLEHIALIANGDVVALPGGRSMDHPVRHLARILHVLLERSSAPPQLEQFVAVNLTEPPQIPTVEEFAMQLAFFERPGRRSDVEQLVARALSAEAQTQAEEELKRLKAKAMEAASHAEMPLGEPAPPPRLQSRQAAVVAALLIVIALAGAGWWWFGGGRGEPAAVTAGSVPEETEGAGVPQNGSGADAPGGGAAPVGDPGGEGVAPGQSPAGGPSSEQPVGTGSAAASAAPKPAPSLLERTKSTISRAVQFAFGPSEASGPPEAPAVEASTERPGPADAAARARTERRRNRASPGQPAARTAPAATPAVRSDPPQVSAVVSEPPVTGAPPMSVAATTLPRNVVYTAADSDVMPAMLLRPVLPATPPPDVPPNQIGTLELVVDEQGDVERVRLVSPSNRFHERMLVAHAKTWKFRPAMREGQPVKFRTVVRLTI